MTFVGTQHEIYDCIIKKTGEKIPKHKCKDVPHPRLHMYECDLPICTTPTTTTTTRPTTTTTPTPTTTTTRTTTTR